MIDLSLPSPSASKMEHSTSSTPSQTAPAHNPTPVASRNLLKHGDGFERFSQPKLSTLFPSYEDLWKEFIWDLTDRDFSGGQGKVRHAASLHLRRFASAHYTFLRSLLFADGLRALPNLGKGHQLEPYFCNERPLNFYVHLGRVRDMVCLMAEEFETERSGTKTSFRRGKGPFWDYSKVATHLNSFPSTPGNAFDAWQNEVGKYRDFIHKTAHAVAIDSTGKWHILKSNLVDKVKDWTEVNLRPLTDFDDLQQTMDKHINDLLRFGAPIWNYFISETQKWKGDRTYRKRLALP